MESVLEDLNNILSSGDVPNIYEPEDFERIYMSVRHAVMEINLAGTKTNLFSCYQQRVRSNLHIVIVRSPIGESIAQFSDAEKKLREEIEHASQIGEMRSRLAAETAERAQLITALLPAAQDAAAYDLYGK